jgi:hypothetical protein
MRKLRMAPSVDHVDNAGALFDAAANKVDMAGNLTFPANATEDVTTFAAKPGVSVQLSHVLYATFNSP